MRGGLIGARTLSRRVDARDEGAGDLELGREGRSSGNDAAPGGDLDALARSAARSGDREVVRVAAVVATQRCVPVTVVAKGADVAVAVVPASCTGSCS